MCTIALSRLNYLNLYSNIPCAELFLNSKPIFYDLITHSLEIIDLLYECRTQF